MNRESRGPTTTGLGVDASRGLIATLGSRWSGTVLTIGSSLVLARLLTPAEFGISAVVLLLAGFLAIFQDFGLGSAAVSASQITARDQMSLAMCNVFLGALLFGLLLAGSGVISDILSMPESRVPIGFFSVTLFISSLGAQPRALMLRQLRFATVARIQIATVAVQSLLAIVLASCGAGVWAIIVSHVAACVVWTFATVYFSGFQIVLPSRWRDFRHLLFSGISISILQASTLIARSFDTLLLARLTSPYEVGQYSRASQTIGMVEDQIISGLTGITVPIVSKMRDDVVRVQRAVRRAITAIGLGLVPLCLLISLLAPPAIDFVYGDQWGQAGDLLTVLGVAGIFRALFVLVEHLSIAVNCVRRTIVSIVALVPAGVVLIWSLAEYGVIGVAFGYLVFTVVAAFALLLMLCITIRIRFWSICRSFFLLLLLWGAAYAVSRVLLAVVNLDSSVSLYSLAALLYLHLGLLGCLAIPSVRGDYLEFWKFVKSGIGR